MRTDIFMFGIALIFLLPYFFVFLFIFICLSKFFPLNCNWLQIALYRYCQQKFEHLPNYFSHTRFKDVCSVARKGRECWNKPFLSSWLWVRIQTKNPDPVIHVNPNPIRIYNIEHFTCSGWHLSAGEEGWALSGPGGALPFRPQDGNLPEVLLWWMWRYVHRVLYELASVFWIPRTGTLGLVNCRLWSQTSLGKFNMNINIWH